MNMRPIIAVIIGVILGGFFVAFGETMLTFIFPSMKPPTSIDITNLSTYVENIPFSAKIGLVINWAVAGFIGATATTFIQGRTHYKPMLVTVGILQLLTYMNMMILWGHPLWMWVAATFIYVIAGFTSYFLIRKKNGHAN